MLGIACCVQCPQKVAMVRSCATSLSNWIGCPCAGRVPARPCGYNGRSRPEGAIWRRDLRSQATAQMARWLLSALRHKHGGSDIIMVATTITPFAGAQYQRGHGLGSIFKGLFRSAILLLKGPVLRAGVHMASDVLRGKTMKQALKNRVAPLVGDLVRQPQPDPSESVPLRPDDGRPRGECPLEGVPRNALAKETSLPYKGGGPLGRVLTRMPAVLAGCRSRPTHNSPVCLAPRVN